MIVKFENIDVSKLVIFDVEFGISLSGCLVGILFVVISK